jgi:hypothetical protein
VVIIASYNELCDYLSHMIIIAIGCTEKVSAHAQMTLSESVAVAGGHPGYRHQSW